MVAAKREEIVAEGKPWKKEMTACQDECLQFGEIMSITLSLKPAQEQKQQQQQQQKSCHCIFNFMKIGLPKLLGALFELFILTNAKY